MNDLDVRGALGSASNLFILLLGLPDIADDRVVYNPDSDLSLNADFLPSISCLICATLFLNGALFYPSPVSTLDVAVFFIFVIDFVFLYNASFFS